MLLSMREWPRMHSRIVVRVISSATRTISKPDFPRSASQYRTSMLGVGKHRTNQLTIQDAHEQNLGRTMCTSTSSTIGNLSVPLTIGKNEIREFMAVYPDVVSELTEFANRYESKVAANWFEKALQYNLSPTNMKNSVITVLTYKHLVKGDQLTAENLRLAHLLGWCLELLHSVILITDDIVDNSTTRRGQFCWYKLEDVGFNAVNDAFMIENGIYELLKKHFRHLDCYVDQVELFRQSTFKFISGQTMDMLVGRRSVTTFTRNIYNEIVMNKTASYFFYLPMALALHLANVKDQKMFSECEAIAIELGKFYQVQNDFLDCFGSPDFTGKIGTDIEANKCTWLAVTCMELANPEQKSLMEECYGQNDPQKIARVKQLYEELNIPSLYAKHEEETYNRIKTLIQQASDNMPREVLQEVLNTIYKREIK
ncbi:farnesyl pyrophosphate synthase-like isoform X4 [Anastrepha ludens]|nr:farnesyl pyrophosphate synthase-like isoform X4 [Anastrepha ludens]XP_053962455.1 farnesyl pyrophosphate synthase-like isoform X4 [Anastrepha ludens]